MLDVLILGQVNSSGDISAITLTTLVCNAHFHIFNGNPLRFFEINFKIYDHEA
jgi:hypothetical protein